MSTLTVNEEANVTAIEKDIHWKQLWSLAALYASVIIGWIAYKNYQPKLLVQFNFTDFTFLLLVAQAVILAATPLIAGKVGDRFRIENGHRLPIISSGISFAAMVFMAVAFTLMGNPGGMFRWILPVLIIVWLISMSIFTSPALSMMELFTPIEKLPRAMALLTITGNFVYALEPVIVHLIDYLGAPVTFVLGGIAVLISGYALKKNSFLLFKKSGEREIAYTNRTGGSAYGFIFFLGLSVGLATTVIFHFFPIIFRASFLSDVSYLVAGILMLSALISWPISSLVQKRGMERSFWISLFCVLAATTGFYCMASTAVQVILVVIFTLGFTALSVASLPLAIKSAAPHEKVFCVGIFFSGAAMPESIWTVLGL